MAENYDEFTDPEPGEGSGGGELPDFNVDDEYKAPPLIPKGTYHGVVNGVSLVLEKSKIVWDVCLQNNDGVMNDGETPIDGAHVEFNNWLPKVGDELITTKKGNMTKRQSKINQIGDFQKDMDINMGSPNAIATAITESQWIGLDVDVDVSIGEWQGRFRNQVDRMRKGKSVS